MLTRTQNKTLDFIIRFFREYGISPTFQQIQEGCGFSSLGQVNRYVNALKAEGCLNSGPDNAKRSLRVLKPPKKDNVTTIPLVGEVAAGNPIDPIEDIETRDVPDWLIKGKADCVGVRVKGDSMIDDGIRDGDYIVIQRQATARQGDIVVAFVNGEITLKEYIRHPNKIELKPHNQKMKSLFVNAKDDFSIYGKAVGLFRIYS